MPAAAMLLIVGCDAADSTASPQATADVTAGDGSTVPTPSTPALATAAPTAPAPAATAADSSAPAPATSAPSAPTSPDTPEPTASPAPLVAEPSGLRGVTLGEPFASAVAAMRARFGDPDADSGWGPAAASPFGVCPGATEGGQVRGVRWGRVRLLFADAQTTYGSAGYEHLFAYDITSFQGDGPAPATAAGVGLGSTAADLRAAYGERLTIQAADEILPDRFRVRFGRDGAISGSLDGPAPDGTVTFFGAGLPCGE